ncbi:MAG TPA: SDR family oxidoreductase [Terriglobia bacterium]|nr:SDR family oxidoreductase [Terriglobia bacterium]
MSKPKNVFITGATGFVGSHLAVRFLDAGYHVTALARGSKSASAESRVRDVLNDVGTSRLENLRVMEGDISLPDLGLNETAKRQVLASTDEVWHCAASLSFQQEDREEIFRMNVDGTRHVVDLVKQLPSRRLHHVSTAYVAGNRPDLALETEINVGQTFKNAYEESKCRAEMLISDAQSSQTIVASVYRPSIVIGDSRSGRATHFHGVYAFIRALWTALERLRRRMPERGLVHLPMRVLGSETQTLNFVPIDYVIDGMVTISERSDSPGGTYHLANPVPTENRVWLRNICRILGVEGIELAGADSFVKTPMTRLEGLFQKQMAFYYQYLQGEPRFDCRRALEALKGTGIECPAVNVEFINKMIGWYVDFLNSSAA